MSPVLRRRIQRLRHGGSQPFSHTCVPIAVTTIRSLARVAATEAKRSASASFVPASSSRNSTKDLNDAGLRTGFGADDQRLRRRTREAIEEQTRTAASVPPQYGGTDFQNEQPPGRAPQSRNCMNGSSCSMRNIQMTIKRLVAIEGSGSTLSACPLCGALPEGRHHDAACDGNVAAVMQDADQHILPLFSGLIWPLTLVHASRSRQRKCRRRLGEWHSRRPFPSLCYSVPGTSFGKYNGQHERTAWEAGFLGCPAEFSGWYVVCFAVHFGIQTGSIG
jgi:hypothetical protein